MSFGNKGGGSRTGRQYPEQVTTSLTAEHYAYLQLKRRHEIGHLSLADVMRECIERCQALDGTLGGDTGTATVIDPSGRPGW